MSVRLLAGPFNTTLNGAPESLVVQAVARMWVPGSGGMLSDSVGSEFLGRTIPTGMMTLDGRFCDRSNEIISNPSWWPAKGLVIACAFGFPYTDSTELRYDAITFARQATGPAASGISPLANKRYVKLADRSIFYDPSGTFIVDPEWGSTYRHSFRVVINDVEAAPEGPPAPFANGTVHPGRSETEVFVSTSSAYEAFWRGIFYDTVTQTWSSPVYVIGMPCYTLVYATDFGVLVSTHNYVSNPDKLLGMDSNQVRVWSLEVNPTILTPVEAIDELASPPEVLTSVRSGQVVTYRVQATGDQDDPAEGELVEWSLSGAGLLLNIQSKTDQEGYATTQVQYGTTETGTSVVEATLLC